MKLSIVAVLAGGIAATLGRGLTWSWNATTAMNIGNPEATTWVTAVKSGVNETRQASNVSISMGNVASAMVTVALGTEIESVNVTNNHGLALPRALDAQVVDRVDGTFGMDESALTTAFVDAQGIRTYTQGQAQSSTIDGSDIVPPHYVVTETVTTTVFMSNAMEDVPTMVCALSITEHDMSSITDAVGITASPTDYDYAFSASVSTATCDEETIEASSTVDAEVTALTSTCDETTSSAVDAAGITFTTVMITPSTTCDETDLPSTAEVEVTTPTSTCDETTSSTVDAAGITFTTVTVTPSTTCDETTSATVDTADMPFTTITVFPSSSTVTVADITTLSVIATSTSSIQKPIFSSIDTLGNSTVISTPSATLPALNGTRSETTSTSVHFLISTIDIASVTADTTTAAVPEKTTTTTGASATPSSSLTSLMNTKPHHHKTSPAEPFSTITSILETVPIDEQTSTIIVGAVTFTTLQLFSTITETISPLPLSSPSSSSTADVGHLVADSQ